VLLTPTYRHQHRALLRRVDVQLSHVAPDVVPGDDGRHVRPRLGGQPDADMPGDGRVVQHRGQPLRPYVVGPEAEEAPRMRRCARLRGLGGAVREHRAHLCGRDRGAGHVATHAVGCFGRRHVRPRLVRQPDARVPIDGRL
jgi:hypothetical protein